MILSVYNQPDDLSANRLGQLAPAQKKRLSARLAPLRAGVFFFVLIIGGIAYRFFSPPPLGQGEGIFWGLFAAMFLAFLVWSSSRLLVAGPELRAGRVEVAQGEVVWNGNRYEAKVEGRKLSLPWDGLAPGSYQFYFLPRQGLVVAAELLDELTTEKQLDQLRHVLIQTVGFRPEALADYQAGTIGRDRWPRLRKMWSSSGWTLLIALILLVAFVIVVAQDETNPVSYFLCAGDMILAILLVILALGAIRPTFDIWSGKVMAIEGLVRKHKWSGSRSSTFYYDLGDLHFTVSPAAYHALLDGWNYRLYYLPRSKKLLAVEPLAVE